MVRPLGLREASGQGDGIKYCQLLTCPTDDATLDGRSSTGS